MAKQSNLEKIGFERRNEYELVRNDIQKNQPYNADHDMDKWHEDEPNKPLGKGTGHGGHGHTLPQEYNELTKNMPSNQFDIEHGGGSYDIYGHPEKGGGRKFLTTINIYGKDNQYGVNSVDTEANIEDGQYFVK